MIWGNSENVMLTQRWYKYTFLSSQCQVLHVKDMEVGLVASKLSFVGGY